MKMRNIALLYKNLHSRFISVPYILASLFLFLTIRKYVSPKDGNLREFQSESEKIVVIYSYGENLGNGGIIDESNLSFLIRWVLEEMFLERAIQIIKLIIS